VEPAGGAGGPKQDSDDGGEETQREEDLEGFGAPSIQS